MLEPHRDKLTEAQYNEQKERGIEAMVRRMLESKLMYVSFLQQIPKDKVAEAIVGVREEAFKQYDEKELKRRMKAQVDAAIKADRLKPSQAMQLLDDYSRGLGQYTYLSIK